eukprot:UN08619
MTYLIRKWTMFRTAEIEPAEPYGTVIMSGPICPIQVLQTLSVGDSAQESLLGFVSSYHSFWKGGIELRFEVIATAYHKLRLTFVPITIRT